MPVHNLRLRNIGPFDDIEFQLDERINVFVGPNNSGKSTILAALGEILVYPFYIPSKLLHQDRSSFELIYSAPNVKPITWAGTFPVETGSDEDFNHSFERVLKVIGYSCYVPALRHGTDFRSKGPGASPDEDRVRERAQRKHDQANLWEDLASESGPSVEQKRRERLFRNESSLLTDKAIVQTIIDMDYRAYRESKPSVRKIINQIAELASEITEGFPIEFSGIGEDSTGLFPQFKTPDGVVPLNVLSQGTQSIIQWLSYLLIGYSAYYDFPNSLEDKPGVLIIDEIDAHLHPSWQRRILPTLSKKFPKLTIFCSTHSPLMLAGLDAGQVQLLSRDSHGKLKVSRNKTDVIGWSADEVLRTFLNVSTPTDLGTESDLQQLQALRKQEKLSAEDGRRLEQLRHRVSQELLGSLADESGEQVQIWLESHKKGASPSEEVHTGRAKTRGKSPTEGKRRTAKKATKHKVR